jgi:hypothetical protein
MSESSFTNCLPHFEGEKVFGFAKQPIDYPPSADEYSHYFDYVKFFHPHVGKNML